VHGSLVPLDLPGTSLVRVSFVTASRYQAITDKLGKCAAFYSMPGILSFFFWTGQSSPTLINNNNVLGLVPTDDQERIIADLEKHHHLCILEIPSLLERFDREQIAKNPPLLRYIRENFTKVETVDKFQILIRRDPNPVSEGG
jgi:hypothetical protein